MLFNAKALAHCLTAAFLMVSPSALAERSGEAIYLQHCAVCHDNGVAGAQLLGDTVAWQALESKGLDALLESTKVSITAMPPMGTCMDCSDKELKNTLQYMIDASK